MQLLPEDETPTPATQSLRPLDHDILIGAIRDGLPLITDPGHLPRLSLAGTQDKLALRATQTAEGSWTSALPEGGAASSHILKLPGRDLKHVPVIEAYTSFIAGQLGLPVAETHLLRLGEHHVSLSRRYDRQEHEGQLRRLHQEDFCQAQGLPAAAKYSDQGARLGQVALLLRQHALQPAQDLRTLIQWQVFNAMAGNTGGHLKNIALLATDTGWRLAPCYDLVCTLAIPEIGHRLALPVGSCDDPQNLRTPHWHALAAETGVGKKLCARLIREQAEHLLDSLEHWHTLFNATHDVETMTQPVRNILRRQYRKALRDWL